MTTRVDRGKYYTHPPPIKRKRISTVGESSGLHQFLESLEKRAKNFGWDKGILMIPSVTGAPQISILRDYRTIVIARIRAYESSYIDTQPLKLPVRAKGGQNKVIN